MPHLPIPRLPVRLCIVKHARLELSASDVVSVRHLAGLGEMSHTRCQQRDLSPREFRAIRDIAGFLPTVGHPSAVAFTSCFFLTSYSSGMMTPLSKVLELNTRDFHPIRSRPCWAYLHRSDGSATSIFRSLTRRHSMNRADRIRELEDKARWETFRLLIHTFFETPTTRF